MISPQRICDESGNPTQICLPPGMNHGPSLSKQSRVFATDMLQALTLRHKAVLVQDFQGDACTSSRDVSQFPYCWESVPDEHD